MNLDKYFGKEKLPSIIKDPFNKNQVTRISVTYRKSTFSNDWLAHGVVEFQNGNTHGKQEFEGFSFDDVVQKIKPFLENL